ncbi:hypothetical protein B0H17DRAFT_1146394 [Mycena rosella]|uniref:Uncharacterized protein n=1 Tax=Mycena rosella TaxID=1033263 RepID=A0AAD7CNZ8_MYCRO|nr:hypothetical protein B0H17DRAFT_1146394 [Mycena rosella]
MIPAWLNDEQKSFLTGLLPLFVEFRNQQKLGEFWGLVYDEWFAQFPEEVEPMLQEVDSETQHAVGARKRNDLSSLAAKLKKGVANFGEWSDFFYLTNARASHRPYILAMAPKPWTTTEESAWLQGKIPEYRTKQVEQRLYRFWPDMKAAWFRKFPEEAHLGIPGVTDEGDTPELTPDQSSVLHAALVARDAQLENWFRHHANKTTTVSAAQTNVVDSLASMLFKPSARQRIHQPIEIFQKLHPLEIDAALDAAGFFGLNEERASQEVEGWSEEADDAARAPIKQNQARQMAIQTEVVKSLYRKASEEEKDAIDVMIDEERKLLAKKKTKKGKGMDAEGDEIEMRPEDYQRICFGKSPAGNDFQAAHGSFDESISVLFQAFLKRSFTCAQCHVRALIQLQEAEVILPSLNALFRLPDVPEEPAVMPAKHAKAKRVVKKKKTLLVPAAASTSSAPAPAVLSSNEGPEVSLSSDEQPSYDHSDSALDFSSSPDEHASPVTVSALAFAEREARGGATYIQAVVPNDTAVIDPSLLKTPESPASPMCPAPHPFTGGAQPHPFTTPAATLTTNVLGFNFPQSLGLGEERLTRLLDSFRQHVSLSPVRDQGGPEPAPSIFGLRVPSLSMLMPSPTPANVADPALQRTFTFASEPAASKGSAPLLVPTAAAAATPLQPTIATVPKRAGPRAPKHTGATAAAALLSAAISNAAAQVSPAPFRRERCGCMGAALSNAAGQTLLALSTANVAGTLAASSAPAVQASSTPAIQGSTASGIAHPAPPADTAPPSSPPARAPIFICSHPMAKTPKAKPNSKAATATKANATKPLAMAAAKKASTKSKAAGKAKVKAGQVSSEGVALTDVETADSKDTKNATVAAATPALIYTSSNDCRDFNRKVDADAAAAKARLRAHNKLVFNPDGPRPLDILPGPLRAEGEGHAWKPARNLDSSVYQPPLKKLTRKEQQALKAQSQNLPCEDVLLARSAAARKREAEEEAAGSASTKK